MKQIWKIVRSINTVTFKEDDYTKSTLSDNSYDLVYNFCVYEQLTKVEGQLLLKEMYRVSRKYVLFFVHNDKTILTPFKKIFSSNDKKLILRQNIQSILSFYNHVGLHVVTKERGYFDFPPWPDINMNLTGSLHKTNLEYKELCKQAQKLRPHVKTKKIDDIINGNFSESDDSSMIRLIDWWLKHMESKTPKFIKRWWAHHPYILLEKR
jgi:hypothetical protein